MAEEGQEVSNEPEEAEVIELTEREQIIAGGGDPDDSQYEESSEEEAVSEDHDDDSSGGDTAEPADSPWITDNIRQVAASYGMGEEHLQNLGSELAFQQAAKMIDGTFANVANDPNFGQPVEQQHAESASESADPMVDDFNKKIDALRDSGYEDDVLDILKTEHEANVHLRGEITDIQVRHNDEAIANHAIDFHDLVDELNPELFGVSYADGEYRELTPEQDNNRRQLWTGMDTIAAGIYQTAARDGVPPVVPEDKVLAERAKMMLFSSEVQGQERKKISRQLQQQSKKRRPVGAASRSEPAAIPSSDQQAIDIANHPALVEFWDKAQQE